MLSLFVLMLIAGGNRLKLTAVCFPRISYPECALAVCHTKKLQDRPVFPSPALIKAFLQKSILPAPAVKNCTHMV
jgi:hypothetical protein